MMGEVDEAVALFHRLETYANPLGLFSEDIEPETGALLGNFPQAYTHVGLIHAAITIGEILDARTRPLPRLDVSCRPGARTRPGEAARRSARAGMARLAHARREAARLAGSRAARLGRHTRSTPAAQRRRSRRSRPVPRETSKRGLPASRRRAASRQRLAAPTLAAASAICARWCRLCHAYICTNASTLIGPISGWRAGRANWSGVSDSSTVFRR